MKIALYIFVAVVIHEAFGKHLLSSFFCVTVKRTVYIARYNRVILFDA